MNNPLALTVLSLASLSLLLALEGQPAAAEDTHPGAGEGTMWLVSPLAGWNRDQRDARGGPGGRQVSTRTADAPIFGLFAMMASPRIVVHNFLFYTKPSDSDVLGNLFFANLYGDPAAALTWNLGGGYLYHRIKPDDEKIRVQVPMVKAGPIVRIKAWGVTLNPYVGYAWERIYTLHADTDNDSCLYGLSADGRWGMIDLNVKYYYQDSRENDEGYDTVRARFVVGLDRRWGVAARFDYMEHMNMSDTSIMLGPVYVF